MPKLPDVQVFKEYLDATSLHRQIETVEVGRHDILGNTSTRSLQRRLKGRAFESTRRHGKYLFVEISADGWLVMHFGMTGYLKFSKREDPPKHTRVLFRFDDDSYLAYVCMRMLGTVDWIRAPDDFIQRKELGIDALSDELDSRQFHEVIAGKRGSIKSALIDQQTVAGLGNIYVDEILFQARVHPTNDIADLDKTRLRKIYRDMRRVLTSAIRAQADPERMAKSFLLRHRGAKGAKCPRCRSSFETAKISGRTTYFCPQCQPL